MAISTSTPRSSFLILIGEGDAADQKGPRSAVGALGVFFERRQGDLIGQARGSGR